jgi:hypothetical protein
MLSDDVNVENLKRGGAPVGYISDLNDVEYTAVMYFRLCCSGLESQNQIARNFRISLGYADGYKATKSFGDLCDLILKKGRRSLISHPVGFKYVGADENCFSQLILTASSSDREDALLIAMLLAPPSLAPILYGLAQEAGLAIKRMFSGISKIKKTDSFSSLMMN